MIKTLGISEKTDLYKLIALYAFNQFYNADEDNIDDVLNGIVYSPSTHVDGIFLNEQGPEDAIEIVVSYIPSGAGFDINEVMKNLINVVGHINNVKAGKYISGDKKADDAIAEALNEYRDEDGTIYPIRLQVITNADETEKEAFIHRKQVVEKEFYAPGLKVEAAILYGKDIEDLIEGNIGETDTVKQGSLIIDKPGNIATFGDGSFICNISALSLKELWKKENNRGLLAMNLRYYVKSVSIDRKIEYSITEDSDNFWYYNNGIIIVCDDFLFEGTKLKMKNFSIVNGGQTTNRIGTIPFDKDFFLTCKVVKNTFTDDKQKTSFVANVAEASNSQKPINAKDRIANKIEQRTLKSILAENGIFCEIKRGEDINKSIFKEPWQKTKNNQLAQDLYSFIYLQPGPARNSVSKILESEDKYKTIFVDRNYSPELIKDILYLEKAYQSYAKEIAKSESEKYDAAYKGLVKNGQFYVLATIGYILKLGFNPEYSNTVLKYRNSENLHDQFGGEMAFNRGFLVHMDYKTFVKSSKLYFDYIITNIIKPVFLIARGANPNLVYSNWTKSNTGFRLIQNYIEIDFFDTKKKEHFKFLAPTCREVTEKSKELDAKTYKDAIANHLEIKAKSNSGQEINKEDEELRNKLMEFRLNTSLKRHISGTKVLPDSMLDKIVEKKPINDKELRQIVNGDIAFYSGKEILEIVAKYVK